MRQKVKTKIADESVDIPARPSKQAKEHPMKQILKQDFAQQLRKEFKIKELKPLTGKGQFTSTLAQIALTDPVAGMAAIASHNEGINRHNPASRASLPGRREVARFTQNCYISSKLEDAIQQLKTPTRIATVISDSSSPSTTFGPRRFTHINPTSISNLASIKKKYYTESMPSPAREDNKSFTQT